MKKISDVFNEEIEIGSLPQVPKAKSLDQKILEIKTKLNLKKDGINDFGGFKYFELAHILPPLHKLMLEENINDRITIETKFISPCGSKIYYEMILKIVDTITGDVIEFKQPFIEYQKPQSASKIQEAQHFGSLLTYNKKYLYFTAFGITEHDLIDGGDYNEDVNEQKGGKDTKNTKEEKQANILSLKERDDFIKFINENNLDINKLAKKFKLTKNSKAEDYIKALANIQTLADLSEYKKDTESNE